MIIFRDNADTEWPHSKQSIQQKVSDVYKRFGNCALLYVTRYDRAQINPAVEMYQWTAQPDDPQTIHAKHKIVDLINGEQNVFKTADELQEMFKAKGICSITEKFTTI